jgi:hypothetical protein
VPIETLDRLCLNQIVRFKRPRHYRFIDLMPKNNYKVLKTKLRRRLDEAGRTAQLGASGGGKSSLGRGRGQENPRIHYLPDRRSDAGR